MMTNNILSRNERNVLAELVGSARKSDSEIAVKAKITPQGARKIRLKLEKEYIKEYRTIVDYDRIGIKVFAIVQAKIKNRQALDDKNIIGAFEINESRITHILIMGFCTLEELDDYKEKISKIAEIQKINVVSKKGFLKNNPKELISAMLSGKKK